MVGSFLTGRLATRLPAWVLMLTGRLLACASLTLGLGALALGIVHPITFFGSVIFVGMANGLTLPNSNTRIVSIRPSLAGTAAGWSAAISVAGGAVLTTITGRVIPAEGGAPVLLSLMLGGAVVALSALLWAIWLERGEADATRSRA